MIRFFSILLLPHRPRSWLALLLHYLLCWVDLDIRQDRRLLHAITSLGMRPKASSFVPARCTELMTAIRAAIHDSLVVLVALLTFCCVDDDLLKGLVSRLSHKELVRRRK